MKKNIPLCLSAALVLLASCGKEEQLGSPSEYTDFGSKTELSSTRQSKDAQIDYLNKTGIDFLSEFEGLDKVIMTIRDVTSQLEDIKDPEVYAPFASAVAAAVTIVEDGEYTGDLPSGIDPTRKIMKIKKTIDPSALKGSFEISEDATSMSFVESNDFRLVSYGREQNKFETRLAMSSSSSNIVYFGKGFDYEEYSYEEYYIVLPKKIDVTVKSDGKIILDVHLNVNVKSLDDVYFNYASSSFEISGNATVMGVRLNIDKIRYEGNKSVELYANMVKDGKKLASVAGAFDFELRRSLRNAPGDTLKVTDVKLLENLDLSVNVLGRVQLKAKSKDVVTAVLRYLDNSDATADLRKMVDASIYFDNGSKKQASLDFDYMAPYGSRPGMNDASICYGDADDDRCAFYDYFNSSNFEALINKWNDFIGK